MTVQSKLAMSCHEFVHPWSANCYNSAAGILFISALQSLKMYSVVYALTLILRRKIPTLKALKQTIIGILQSSAFLSANGTLFFLFTCLIRNLLGKFSYATLTWLPSLLSSFAAILIERPARRPLLALYVANSATETIWNMMESRGLVKSIPNGQAIVFGVSIGILLYLYRLGQHKTDCKDPIFDVLRIFVGKDEEGGLETAKDEVELPKKRISSCGNSRIIETYLKLINAKHESCLHTKSCVRYSLLGGVRPFIGGVGLQVLVKLLLSSKNIVRNKMNWRKALVNSQTLKLGLFMGGFSLLYKAVSCAQRHSFGRDDPLFAIPAGLIGSLAFVQYPNTTIACYVMWKMFQMTYSVGISKGVLPEVPGFTVILYALATATLFQAAIFEPQYVRPSYWKFLQTLSGLRVGQIDRSVIGKSTQQNVHEILRRSGDLGKSVLFPMP